MSVEKALEELYYQSGTVFLSRDKFWKKVKEEGINASYNDVKKFLEKQETYQINKPFKKPEEFSTIMAYFPLQCVQLDICVYDRFALHNYKYILGVIDVYSRYVICKALTNMRMDTIMSKLKEIFDEFGELVNDNGYPRNINCDQQFNKKEFVDFFTSKGTRLWFSQPSQPHKNALIERFWRTLAQILQRARNSIGSFDWIKELPDIVSNYNQTYHNTLKATPKQVLEGMKKNPVKKKVVESNLDVGDRVRVRQEKSIFAKGDLSTWRKDK